MTDTVAMPDKTEEEKEWMAENDAHTLTEAEVIKADPERFKMAQEVAKKIAEDQKAKAEAMQRIANAKMEYKNSPKE